MRSVLIILASAALLAGTAHAQGSQRQDDRRPQQQTQRQTAQPQRQQQANHNTPTRPQHWGNRSEASWTRHVRACQQRYRSYNARTDRYVVRAGQTALCRL